MNRSGRGPTSDLVTPPSRTPKTLGAGGDLPWTMVRCAPWARGRGIAVAAVRALCRFIADEHLGARAAIRVEPANAPSVRVAEKAGFTYVRDFASAHHTEPDGSPSILRLYVHDL